MVKTFEKVILGMLMVAVLGLGSVLVTGSTNFGEDETDEDEAVSAEELELLGSRISEAEAISIALGQVNTALVGGITDVELENENGQIVYAVEFTKHGIETDVKMDAKTGEIVSVESDLDEEDQD